MKLIKLGLASMLTAGALFAGTYNVDQAHSTVAFKVKHLMITNVTGRFDKFSGSFSYDEKTKTLKSLKGTIEVKSVSTGDKKRDDHLRNADFFDAKKYPQIKFTLTKIDDDEAYGKLTMKNITKEVVLDVETTDVMKDLNGNTRVGINLSGEINRKDFGLTWHKALETGGVVVSEDIKLDIDLQGIKTK